MRRAKPKKPKVGAKRPGTRTSLKREGSRARDLEKRLAEALEQQTATAEILSVISRSPSDTQPVFEAIAASAAKLCDGLYSYVVRFDGQLMQLVADHNLTPAGLDALRDVFPFRANRGHVSGRAILARAVVHIPDLVDDPHARQMARATGIRSMLAVPMLKDGEAIGVINVGRAEPVPFTETQIALIKTFADQAVIAIENVRLFKELEARNRDLSEALEQQTATSEILRVISSSPTDVQPVFETIAENALRLCEATFSAVFRYDGELIHLAALRNVTPEGVAAIRDMYPMPPGRGGAAARSILSRSIAHIADVLQDPEYAHRGVAEAAEFRSILSVPMLREGQPIGAITVSGPAARPFPDKQVELLRVFADQAVIAIENVRLFKELEARNRDLTATSEILQVISRSPTDVQPVFDTIVRSAVRLLDGHTALVLRVGDGYLHLAALTSTGDVADEAVRATFPIAVTSGAVASHVVRTGRPYVVADTDTDPLVTENIRRTAPMRGYRSMLFMPMVRDGQVIGVLAVTRRAPGRFSEKEIELLQTFADQAVIAIENVRLFTELEAKNRDLTEALDQQTATSEILRVISSSPTDVQPVFDTIVQSAVRLCQSRYCIVWSVEGEQLRIVAHHGVSAAGLEEVGRRYPAALNAPYNSVRSVRERAVIQLTGAQTNPTITEAQRRIARMEGYQSQVFVPMLQEDRCLGVIGLTRPEDEPFPETQIALLKTFADQAVIAIENVRLFTELEARNRDLTEALDQQTATAEILRAISSSPTDIRPVLETLVHAAARFCAAPNVALLRLDGGVLRGAAATGPFGEEMVRSFGSIEALEMPVTRESVTGRAVVERRTVHIHDLTAEPENEFPVGRELQRRLGHRTMVATPLLREGVPIGAIDLIRTEVAPFSDKQLALLRIFADQAVIAIENVRLFTELQEKNQALTEAHAQVTEALEQQTATSEILRVISSSPTDLQPVLDAMAENAARLCNAQDVAIMRTEGEFLRVVASVGPFGTAISTGMAEFRYGITRGGVAGRAVVDRTTVHVHDLAAESDDEYPTGKELQRRFGHRTLVATPLLREEAVLGVIVVFTAEVRPFTASQIELLQTFADQAVIAIENVRLFKELQARTQELGQTVEELQTLGEVSRAVSSSLNLRQVLDSVVGHAARLSGADGCGIFEFNPERGSFEVVASHNLGTRFLEGIASRVVDPKQATIARAIAAGQPLQIEDVEPERGYLYRDLVLQEGFRALLAVPMGAESAIRGLVLLRRTPGSFPGRVVNVLTALGSQSEVAIENARLFRELDHKGRQLEAASRHKSEFLANMSHELRTPLNAITGFSEVLLERMFGEINPKQTEYLQDILSSGRHLLSLINDILDLSKIEAGRMELTLAQFHLPLALDNAITLVKERVARHGIALDIDVDPALGEFVGDERKIKQILLNLLSNAVKFTPEGGRIGVKAGLADGAVEISVSDTGIGIAPKDQEAIFEEFRQVGSDEARKVEGTGLGLTLTKKFIEMHGGRIWVESEVGKGSTFTFTLPLK